MQLPTMCTMTNENNIEPFQDKRHFLDILHQLLDKESEDSGHSIVSWSLDGLSFSVYEPVKFAESVLPAYFPSSSTRLTFKSFLGRLKIFGFERNTNNFSHPLFVWGKKILFNRRKSLECWPMPNLKIGSDEMRRLSVPPRQTISDLKRQNGSFVRRKSIVHSLSPEGQKISFKDTLLRRQRSSSVRMIINQNAYLEILRDLSIEDPELNSAQRQFHNNVNKIPNDNIYDAEPLTLTYEEDDTLYDDIADAINSM